MSDLLGLIERRAPALMRAGGGAVRRCDGDKVYAAGPRLRPGKLNQALRLARTGEFTATDIARAVDSTQPVIRRLLIKAGISVPDGRTPRRSKKLPA